MREILFRAKRIDNGEWVEGDLSYLIHNKEKMHVFPADGLDSADRYEVNPETLCQYTGLKDKNGNRIWENDILHVVEKMGNDVYHNGNLVSSPRWINELNFKVEFTPGGLMNTQRFANALQIECEVIGNIFDNPELLKGE